MANFALGCSDVPVLLPEDSGDVALRLRWNLAAVARRQQILPDDLIACCRDPEFNKEPVCRDALKAAERIVEAFDPSADDPFGALRARLAASPEARTLWTAWRTMGSGLSCDLVLALALSSAMPPIARAMAAAACLAQGEASQGRRIVKKMAARHPELSGGFEGFVLGCSEPPCLLPDAFRPDASRLWCMGLKPDGSRHWFEGITPRARLRWTLATVASRGELRLDDLFACCFEPVFNKTPVFCKAWLDVAEAALRSGKALLPPSAPLTARFLAKLAASPAIDGLAALIGERVPCYGTTLRKALLALGPAEKLIALHRAVRQGDMILVNAGAYELARYSDAVLATAR
ncbi:MAG: hypothetical protein HUK26_09415, partial [Duodenibacillus sp.]|nr:hypothetical protein [Duodenibacillus sp.]